MHVEDAASFLLDCLERYAKDAASTLRHKLPDLRLQERRKFEDACPRTMWPHVLQHAAERFPDRWDILRHARRLLGFCTTLSVIVPQSALSLRRWIASGMAGTPLYAGIMEHNWDGLLHEKVGVFDVAKWTDPTFPQKLASSRLGRNPWSLDESTQQTRQRVEHFVLGLQREIQAAVARKASESRNAIRDLQINDLPVKAREHPVHNSYRACSNGPSSRQGRSIRLVVIVGAVAAICVAVLIIFALTVMVKEPGSRSRSAMSINAGPAQKRLRPVTTWSSSS